VRDPRADVARHRRQPVVTLDIATELRGLNRRLRVEQIENAGHALPFEQPERLATPVLSFLRELV
jgi:pimeloyl-ACP methyl ester carboxylesterase